MADQANTRLASVKFAIAAVEIKLDLANLELRRYIVVRYIGYSSPERNAHMTESNGHMTPDQISFYDETLKKQIEGSYRYDGKKIHVASQVYGARSAPARFDGRFDQIAVDLLAQKVLAELARDAEKDVKSHKTAMAKQAKAA